MANYTLKTYDRHGHLVETFEFAAPDDDEAEGAVRDLNVIERAHELWCGLRWIRTWPANHHAA